MTLEYNQITELVNSPEVTAKYEKNTSEALELGVFGAPTFSVGKELFWGDDRLEDAILFAS